MLDRQVVDPFVFLWFSQAWCLLQSSWLHPLSVPTTGLPHRMNLMWYKPLVNQIFSHKHSVFQSRIC